MAIPAVPITTPFYDDKGRIARTWILFLQSLATADPLSNTHAKRVETYPSTGDAKYPAGAYPVGTLFYETDRDVTYKAVDDGSGGHIWQYSHGIMRGTLSPDQKPAGLTADDEGFIFESTDFDHFYRWSGAAWAYAPGDLGSSYVVHWIQTPQKPHAWALCDGSVVTKTTNAGGTASVTLPNLVARYIKGAAAGAYTGATVASTTTLTITGDTADEATHTHPIDHDHPAFTSGATTAAGTLAAGAAAAVDAAHTHQIDPPAYTGASGAGAAHKHGKGTLAASGTVEVAHVALYPYFRL